MTKKEIKKQASLAAIRSVWRPGICSREIAEELGISKSAVCGMYHRYPDAVKDYPLRTPGRGKGEARRQPREIVSKWTPEQKARIADLIKGGGTYQQIADDLCVTRNAVSGVIDRTPELRALKSANGRRKMSEEQRRIKQREANRRYKQKRKAIKLPDNDDRKPFRPVVVSNNIPLMVQDWIAANGVRRFEAGDSADYLCLARYLEERGYKLSMRHGKHTLAGPKGRPRIIEYRDAVAVADRFRRAEGLEPVLATRSFALDRTPTTQGRTGR